MAAKRKVVRTKDTPASAAASAEKVLGPVRDTKNRRTILALKDALNKHFKGKVSVMDGRESFNMFRLRRPTGLLGLDMRIGGGAPAGGMTEIIGKDGVGKTTLTNLMIKENQRIYGAKSNVAIQSVEIPWDKEHARSCGARVAYAPEELDQIEATTGVKFTAEKRDEMLNDQIGEVLETRAKTAELILQITLELISSNQFQLIIFDSLGSLLTDQMDENTMEDKSYGGAAAVITQFCRKLPGELNMKDQWGRMNQTSLVVLNQYRMLIGGNPKANPMNITGGHALKHTKLVDINLINGEKIFGDPADEDKQTGKVTNWKVLKGKAGSHEGWEGSYRYDFDLCSPDYAKEYFAAGQQAKVIEQRGSYYVWGDEKFQGAEPLLAKLKDQSVQDHLRHDVMEKLGIRVLIGL